MFHYADGSGHKNRMQGNDFVQSTMYTHSVGCSSCNDAHGTPNNAGLLKPANVLCLQCHGPTSPNGPRGATIQEHAHHAAGSAVNECVGCHMPKIAQQLAELNVRTNTVAGHILSRLATSFSHIDPRPDGATLRHGGQARAGV